MIKIHHLVNAKFIWGDFSEFRNIVRHFSFVLRQVNFCDDVVDDFLIVHFFRVGRLGAGVGAGAGLGLLQDRSDGRTLQLMPLA